MNTIIRPKRKHIKPICEYLRLHRVPFIIEVGLRRAGRANVEVPQISIRDLSKVHLARIRQFITN